MPDEKPDLDKLIAEGKELSKRIPELAAFVVNRSSGYKEYKIENGLCFGFSLLNIPEVAVMKSIMTSGGTFPEHFQNEIEVLVVVSGRLKVVSGERECELKPGGTITFAPGMMHRVTAVENTKIIGITIPRSDGYPNGG